MTTACRQLIARWRREAQRFREVRDEECTRFNDEWYMNDVDAHRLELCAIELEAALADMPTDTYDVYCQWYLDHYGRPFTGTRDQWQAWVQR